MDKARYTMNPARAMMAALVRGSAAGRWLDVVVGLRKVGRKGDAAGG